MKVRRAGERGLTELGWLTSRHTFSFGAYHDSRHMVFRTLRVINDDRVSAGAGFGMHGHRDMEIITIPLEGELEHRDSLGHGEKIVPGDVQVMSAGRGIRHSEFNPSAGRECRFLQIWIEPALLNIEPRYGRKRFAFESLNNEWLRIAGPKRVDDTALEICQDADLFYGVCNRGAELGFFCEPGRALWLHVLRGQIAAGELSLGGGDAVAVEESGDISLRGVDDRSELLLFRL